MEEAGLWGNASCLWDWGAGKGGLKATADSEQDRALPLGREWPSDVLLAGEKSSLDLMSPLCLIDNKWTD